MKRRNRGHALDSVQFWSRISESRKVTMFVADFFKVQTIKRADSVTRTHQLPLGTHHFSIHCASSFTVTQGSCAVRTALRISRVSNCLNVSRSLHNAVSNHLVACIASWHVNETNSTRFLTGCDSNNTPRTKSQCLQHLQGIAELSCCCAPRCFRSVTSSKTSKQSL